jgi:prepilin signal peptidase PulO-like enzyme (type II secretory pathway)
MCPGSSFLNVPWVKLIGLYIHLAGFIIGLGAVTVIDLHGFLGRKSAYWTEATTRTHKVTKPLIWAGLLLAVLGAVIYHGHRSFSGVLLTQAIIAAVLVLNGIFLSFRVSPFLLEREKAGRAAELLPDSWQHQITVAFIVSFLGWWGELFLTVWQVIMCR